MRSFASRFYLFFDSPRFASAQYFRTEMKLKARSEASRQKKKLRNYAFFDQAFKHVSASGTCV